MRGVLSFLYRRVELKRVAISTRSCGLVPGCCLLLLSTPSQAANWHGAVLTKLQTDNRYSNNASFFAEAIGRFEFEDKQLGLQSAADVLIRQGNYAFNNREDFYRLFIQKTWHALQTTLKAGRFEQTDSMGFYTLNGASAVWQNAQHDTSIEAYGGMPQRFDDLDSVKGDLVLGVKATLLQRPQWHSDWLRLSLDTVDWRLGYQYFAGQDMSRYIPSTQRNTLTATGNKFALGVSIEGQIDGSWAKKYSARLLEVYRVDTHTLEDAQVEGQLDLSKATRVRGTYEYYRPDRFANPTFREQFYSQYGFGKQDLFKLSLHQRWQDAIDYAVGGIYTTRPNGDAGYGFNASVSAKLSRDTKTGVEFDHVQVGKDDVSALYVKNEFFVDSRNSVLLSAALRREDKVLYGENWVKGVETRWNYALQNNIVIGVTANYIWNSTIQNEYLGALQVTYYFDNFKPKAAHD